MSTPAEQDSRACACVHPDARECIHIRTHPVQMDDAMDWPCRTCEDFAEECECSCHDDDPYPED